VLTVRQQYFEESIQSEMMANFERKASMERLYRRKLVRCDVQLIKCSHVGCANDDNHFFSRNGQNMRQNAAKVQSIG
jgi:hypothetical protein